MSSLFSRIIDVVRVWLGLHDPSDPRLHSSHGWLLQTSADVRAAHALELALTLAPIPVSTPSRERR
jgi:hypothetical protein